MKLKMSIVVLISLFHTAIPENTRKMCPCYGMVLSTKEQDEGVG